MKKKIINLNIDPFGETEKDLKLIDWLNQARNIDAGHFKTPKVQIMFS